MKDFLDNLRHTIKKHGMLAPGESVIAAVSGGPDSMAMLYALDELSGPLGFKLTVAHMDHGLRDESPQDALFVEAAAANLGLAYVTRRVELKEALGPGVNKQAAARAARYAFLEEEADRLGADRIAVAHTMDDQAETYLMRELRGSGARGLASIPPVRGRVIRPLIEATRDAVMVYLDMRGIGYTIDPTNLKTDYLRNRLRLELLPALREYNPNIVETLFRSAEILRDEDELLDAQAAEELRGMITDDRGWLVALDIKAFAGLHPAIRRRVARLVIAGLKGDMLGVSFSHVEDALGLVMQGATGKGMDLPGGVRVELSYENALFYLPEAVPGGFSAALDVPGRVEMPGIGLSVEAEPVGDKAPPQGAVAFEFFDADRLNGPLIIRRRMPGDLFYPCGMQGRKKLKDLFIDMKIPRIERDTTPVLECGGDIAWVMGVRADRRFAAGEGVKKLIRITARKMGPG